MCIANLEWLQMFLWCDAMLHNLKGKHRLVCLITKAEVKLISTSVKLPLVLVSVGISLISYCGQTSVIWMSIIVNNLSSMGFIYKAKPIRTFAVKHSVDKSNCFVGLDGFFLFLLLLFAMIKFVELWGYGFLGRFMSTFPCNIELESLIKPCKCFCWKY